MKDSKFAGTGRRVVFAVLAVLGVAAVVVGILKGDPETIFRFAAQI